MTAYFHRIESERNSIRTEMCWLLPNRKTLVVTEQKSAGCYRTEKRWLLPYRKALVVTVQKSAGCHRTEKRWLSPNGNALVVTERKCVGCHRTFHLNATEIDLKKGDYFVITQLENQESRSKHHVHL